jgi:competence protein ComEA
MVQQSREPSREDQEFWDAQFRDPPRPRRDALDRSRRERRTEREPVWARLSERVGDRLADWRHDTRFGIVVLILIALVAGAIWYRVGIGGASAGAANDAPAAVSTTAPTTTLADAPTTGVNAKGPTTIAVHVAGAVQHPGVVELRTGARVIDAVEAVGGAQTDGDLDRLNLAAKVSDGQRVFVAKVGQSDPGALGGSPTGAPGEDPSGGGTAGGKVDLNTATQAELEALPGIGPTYAQAIIAERQRRGGFTSVNDLRSVRGIGDKRFAELAPLVTV